MKSFLFFLALIWITPPGVSAQEWPPLEPDLVIADGFRQTGWVELRLRGDVWTPEHRQQFSYDDTGRLGSIIHQSMLSDLWRTSRQETYSYDEERHLIEKLIEESVGKHLQNRGRHTYRFEDGYLVEELFDGWSYEQKWEPLFGYGFVYDAAGRLVQHDTRVLQKELVQEPTRIVHHYDAAGRAVESVKKQKKEGAWVDAQKVVYRYDDTGRLTNRSMLVVSKRGPSWFESIKVFHHYDEAGRCIASVTQTRGRTDGLEESARRSYAYDKHGNQIETQYHMKRNGEWSVVRKESFSYEPGSG